MAVREESYFERFGLSEDDVPFQLLVSEHIAQRGEGVGDIAAGLLRGLKRARGHRTRKINVDIQLDLKVVKAAFSVEESTQSMAEAVADSIEQVWDQVRTSFDGIALVIDEIHRVADVDGILGNHRPRAEIAPS